MCRMSAESTKLRPLTITYGIADRIEDNAEEDQARPGFWIIIGRIKHASEPFRQEVKADAGKDEAESHAWDGKDEDTSATDDVDELEREQRAEEVGSGYDQTDGRRVVEAN